MGHPMRWYRRELEKRLPVKVTDVLWDHIVKLADFEEQETDEAEVGIALDLLEEKARATFAATGNPLMSHEDAPMLPPDTGEIRGTAHGAGTASLRLSVGAADSESSTLREQVISRLIARDAANDAAVQRFRTEALAGTLLTSDDDVRAWIIRHARGEPQEQAPQNSEHGNHLGPGLAYSLHGVKQIERPIGAGGVLDRLRRLSEDLAARFAWTDAQATTFVMTGAVPVIREVTTAVEPHAAYPALTRIRLVVSPMATAKEVASRYERACAQIETKRSREPKERQLRLVLFVDAQPAAVAWPERMRAWNTYVAALGHVDWQYTRDTNFKRDARDTRRRLMSPAYRTNTERARSYEKNNYTHDDTP